MKLIDVQIHPLDLERFSPLVGDEVAEQLRSAAERARTMFEGRTVWNVNSTASGGGVAEMLQPLLAYSRGAGVNTRWLVVRGDAAFFAITKRLHNKLHGEPGDGGDLGEEEQRHYEAVLADNAVQLRAMVRSGDVVLLHDPQTAGLVEHMQECGALTLWRSHVGADHPNEHVEEAWSFLRRHVEGADAFVFSREPYVPPFLTENVHIVPPSIDPFSTKNQDLEQDTVRAILAQVGVIQDPAGAAAPVFLRRDGSPGRVDHTADIVRAGPPPTPDTQLVAQVSRWDRLKDMEGVMRGFADHVDGRVDAQLALVGPNVSGVSDDPEGPAVLDECIRGWRELPHAARRRIQLVCLPMDDVEENAAIVNAVQRHAAVVVQKSLAEGFGLTVAEAMWKARPVVGSRLGGIQDQIEHRKTGLLLDNPTDLAGLGAALCELLADPERSRAMGEAARESAIEQFLGSRHLMQYVELLGGLLADHDR